MSVVVLTHSKTVYRTKTLVHRLRKLGIRPVVLLPTECGFIIQPRDSYFIRGSNHIRPRIVLNALYNHPGRGLEYVEALELLGTPIINRATPWRQAKSKPLMTAALARAGIPQPESAFSSNSPPLASYVRGRSQLFVSKPWSGSGGRGIVRRRGPRMARRLQQRDGRQAYVQRYLPSRRRDIRVVVVNGEAIGATYRIARKGRWKTNVAAGGRAVYCKVTDELAALAIRATKALDLDIAGVDIIRSSGRYYVLEVNAWPNYRIFDRIARVDVAMKIARFVARRAGI